MKTLRIRMAAMMLVIVISGCSGIAVLPAKIVYMYPTGELYEQRAANGAVAKIDDGTLSLYLPTFSEDALKPKRFQFRWNEEKKVWEERRGKAIIEPIITPREETLPSGKLLHLGNNMVLVKFSDDRIYGELAGGMIWLTANVGPEEFKKITGIYKESKASYLDIFNQPGDVTGVLQDN